MHLIKFYFLFFSCFVLSTLLKGQEAVVKFESGLSWSEIKAKAKKENKPIFMDCYATWCQPCKFMDLNVYNRLDVGDYFNSHFINIKIQMDRTLKDSQAIRNWYGNADSISKNYLVDVYPTFLFFSKDGQPLNKLVGEFTATDLITYADNSMKVENQYFVLIAGWEKRREDSAYLRNTVTASMRAGDGTKGELVFYQYLQFLRDPIATENIGIMRQFTRTESDRGFRWFLNNARKINQVTGRKDFAEATLSPIIFKEEILSFFIRQDTVLDLLRICENVQNKYPSLDKDLLANQLLQQCSIAIEGDISQAIKGKPFRPSDWRDLSRKLAKRFPGFDLGKVLLDEEARYYFFNASWDEFGKVAIEMLDRYENQMDPKSINNALMRVFSHSEDRTVLKKAIGHMKKVISNYPNDTDYLDTYANLLYKAGLKQEAMDWEKKAIVNCKDSGDLKELNSILKKMESGEITWGEAAVGR